MCSTKKGHRNAGLAQLGHEVRRVHQTDNPDFVTPATLTDSKRHNYSLGTSATKTVNDMENTHVVFLAWASLCSRFRERSQLSRRLRRSLPGFEACSRNYRLDGKIYKNAAGEATECGSSGALSGAPGLPRPLPILKANALESDGLPMLPSLRPLSSPRPRAIGPGVLRLSDL